MKINYHAHTDFCNHASFGVLQLIELAIAHQFSTFGISEHIHSPHYENFWSLQTPEKTKAYVKEVNRYKKQFANQIDVRCGFELDVVDKVKHTVLIDFNNEVKTWPGVDFVILAFHYYQDGTHAFMVPLTKDRTEFMLEALEATFLKTQIKYLAHPDGFMHGHQVWDDLAKHTAHALLELALKYDVILGLNVKGLVDQKFYPYPEFWKIAGTKGVKTMIELDAHSEDAFDEEIYLKARQMVKDYQLNVVDSL